MRLSSVCVPNLQAAQRMLIRLGINSTIYTERHPSGKRMLPDGNGGSKLYDCQAVHDLVISRENLKTFKTLIGFKHPKRALKLDAVLDGYKREVNHDHFYATVSTVEPRGTEQVVDCTIPGPHAFDANGFYVHNCVEIGLDPVWRELEQPNKSGIQLCNLTSINGAQTTSEEEFYLACIWAAFIGTLQAAYTRIPFLGPVTQKINERDALLGVSLCGVMDNPDVLLDPKILTNGAHLVRAVNVWLAEFLGINPSARSTCVKPEGTASLVLGAASGIHPHHAPMYFRRVTANRLEPIYTFFKERNPQMTEVSVYNPERDDKIVFPVKAPEGAICRKDIGAVQFLEIVKLVQQAWVIPGNRDKDSKINHNVSNTCTVKAEEWDAVREFIWTNREFFTGISLLAWEGDKRYAQAPNEEVTTEGDIAKWNALKPVVVDYSQMQEATDETKLSEVAACANGQCDLK